MENLRKGLAMFQVEFSHREFGDSTIVEDRKFFSMSLDPMSSIQF